MNVVWRLIRAQLGQRKGAMTTVFLLTALVAATPYAFSFLGKWLVDEALQVTGPPKPAPTQDTDQAKTGTATSLPIEWKAKTTAEKLRLLLVFLLASMGLHVAGTLLSGLSELLNSRTVHQIIYDLRTSLHAKLANLDMKSFGQEQIGQLMSRVLDDAGGIPGNLTHLVINFCTQFVMLLLGLYLLVRLNPAMTLIALATLPFYALVCVIFLPQMKTNTEDIRQKGAELNGFVIERLSNVLTIKNYAQEAREVVNFGNRTDDNIALARRQHRLSLTFSTLTTLISGAGTLGVLAYGFLNIREGKMQLGEVLAFYQVTAQLFVPIGALVGTASVAQAIQVLGERVYGILDTPQALSEAPDAIDPQEMKGDIRFDHVTLQYEEGGPFAVRDVNLSIPAGKTVCIVGPTGAGKSTLLLLLTRLYDPTEGEIALDGVDIRKIPLQVLRRSIGNVPQECQVFTGTVAENIAYGDPDASQDEIEAVARLVGFEEFVQRLPKGYQTELGRGGTTLGPVERAALSLARAMVTDPVALAVDNVFAVVEEDVEERLRSAIRTKLVNHTVLIATSRLSVCEDADVVVVMRNGEIQQVGTHQELLASPGTYRRMYMRQMGMEAVDAVSQDQEGPSTEQGPSG